MGHPWARPLLMVWVMISPLSSLHVSSCPALKRTVDHFHTSLSRASISLWMAPYSTAPWAFFTSTLAMAASRWMATWAETILWSSSGPCFIPAANWCGLEILRTFFVRSQAVAVQTSRLMTCPMAKGRTPPLGAEGLCWNVSSGESPEGFPHAVTWVSVKFGHPSPVLVPSTTRSRGSVGGREFDSEQELTEEALLVFFGEGEGLRVTNLRLGLRVELGPVSLYVRSWGHSADALDHLACSPTVPVFHS